jgi:hypothetical protein
MTVIIRRRICVGNAFFRHVQGVPPAMCLGDDDIAWVSRLHRALSENGYYTNDEEEETWLFGQGTQEAVMTAQAAAGLPETGTAAGSFPHLPCIGALSHGWC